MSSQKEKKKHEMLDRCKRQLFFLAAKQPLQNTLSFEARLFIGKAKKYIVFEHHFMCINHIYFLAGRNLMRNGTKVSFLLYL